MVGRIRPIGRIGLIGLIGLISLISPVGLLAQTIGGNVYGGGNQGNVNGNTKVTVLSGDIDRVFGGARMSNVGGRAFVNIDGSDTTNDGSIIINQVFGGNDIAGTIGTSNDELPSELTHITSDPANTDPKKNYIDKTWNTAVRLASTATHSHDTDPTTSKATTHEAVIIGSLYAGGNGDYYYKEENGEHKIYFSEQDYIDHPEAPIASNTTGFTKPELNKTYLELLGGSVAQAFGGGNNATVKEKTIICVDNPSNVVTSVLLDGEELLVTPEREAKMGYNPGYTYMASDAFQFGNVFGGNNQAEMDIMPTWNLQSGKIRNLYSGGNRGSMTSPKGLLLEIDDFYSAVPSGKKLVKGDTYFTSDEGAGKFVATGDETSDGTNYYSTIVVDNVYGGCRIADVKPSVNGLYMPCTNLTETDSEGKLKYKFPNELAARVLIRGGDINNVYGGNDISGTVYGGNAIGIYASIRGDVYGGGNGRYPYTENEALKNNSTYGDLCFEEGADVIASLNAFRPNAEQVSIRLKGKDANHPTIIGGSVYCGGNCASLDTKKDDPMVELKMGSYVIANNVFLGNNGEGMVDENILKHYAGEIINNFSSISLTNEDQFAQYMDGVSVKLHPKIVFDSKDNGDPDDYEDWTSKIGSLFLGGNVGSVAVEGQGVFTFSRGLVIYEKLVGGCNNAYIEAQDGLNAAFDGGILGSKEEQIAAQNGIIKDCLELNLENVVIEPRRWNDVFAPITAADLENGYLKAGEEYYTTTLRTSKFIADGTEVVDLSDADKYYKITTPGTELVWNTTKWSVDEGDFIAIDDVTTADDNDRRLYGGNVYGGCYNSGHSNGNITININQDLIKRDVLFAETDGEDEYKISGARRSGVLLEEQGDDVMAVAMTVFGGGSGEKTEVWGSTTVNLNNGYAFQVFGGSEMGLIGKKNSSGEYAYNANYSTTVNLQGPNPGYPKSEDGGSLAETEYIYGGGNEGDVLGDCYVYLGNGRIYDAFGGASNADVYGGTEVYVGYNNGFPWIRDNVYGGNDFGGTVRGYRNHTTVTLRTPFDTEMLRSATYVKYIQGRVDTIFGGSYGSYDYKDRIFKDYTDADGLPIVENGEPIFRFPHLNRNSFVHFEPADYSKNFVGYIFGGSEGYPGNVNLNDAMQEEAYVLIDDTKTRNADRFANVDIYGGGAFAGVGTEEYFGGGRTAVDLFAGSFNNVYGGCNQEGLVGYARVNVPSNSAIKVNAIYGGGQGYSAKTLSEKPALASRYCDNYVTCIDFRGQNAIVEEAIYGGNQNCRISCDTYINMEAPALQSNGYQATIYGGGNGEETVSGRTNVFMNNGSVAYKVFGGGRDGNVFNFPSLRMWLAQQFKKDGTPDAELAGKVTAYGDILRSFATYINTHPVILPSEIGTYRNAEGNYDGTYTNDILPSTKPIPDYNNTNVHLLNGSNVTGYAYGGGLGETACVAGVTYIELKGGNVDRDIYGGGQGGSVLDEFNLYQEEQYKDFIAQTNVYIESGMVRNVYGGGYLGNVGKHTKIVAGKEVDADISESYAGDNAGETHVVIGKEDGTSFNNGIPAIMRNAYGGGEGGSVYGTANIIVRNGYIGYRYKNTTEGTGTPQYEYVPELDDQKPNAIQGAGNVFGGGYVVNSYVDNTNVEMYGGIVRGSLYGGGELGPIGRGTTKKSAFTTGVVNGDVRIFKAGKTHVRLYDGWVKRDVFGGGRGMDSWGGDGTMYMDAKVVEALEAKGLMCKGYVFGQTEVAIHGGEVGTDEGVAKGEGNVFGGGDIGFVYSAYETDIHYTQAECDTYNTDNNLTEGDAGFRTTSDIKEAGVLCIGKKQGERYDEGDEGYYYKYENGSYLTSGSEKILTEDCKVLVEPWCKAKASTAINGHTFAAGEYVPTEYLNYLGNKNDALWTSLNKADPNKDGILIHNAVFGGGNTSPGSTVVYASTTTVYGNAAAYIHDVYNRDLITVGTGHTGGLYGDGNLTLVDGYRELNITNYGTDYHHILREISYAEYKALPFREAAYYEVRYKCTKACKAYNGRTYAVESTISADELQSLFVELVNGEYVSVKDGDTPILIWNTTTKLWEPNPDGGYWVENGVCSRYAGRIMNTIQRADFCGVFGSRMVMQGAQDRVPATVDYTNYTINRVREVSLNQKASVRADDDGGRTIEDADYYRYNVHGNYFGIYSTVNYLGALTSDVDFGDGGTTSVAGAVRYTDNDDALTYKCAAGNGGKAYKTATYYDWKKAFHNERKRNNGRSPNKVALASGVYLELTTEKSTGTGLREKDWGYITGVVELDLISVQPGLGGGFVYAKNVHGVRKETNLTHTILPGLNDGAVFRKKYTYKEAVVADEWQASGNFVHSSQTIIDDCYNIGGKYHGLDSVPAHYWFIKGSVYIYDQYISAYTGSPNAYSEKTSIPLTITSASHGRMTLLEVQPNYHAYYAVNTGSTKTQLKDGEEIVLRDVAYKLNDPITYWDYFMLSDAEKSLFVNKTYVVKDSCYINSKFYPAGSVLLPEDYTTLETAANADKQVFEENGPELPAVKKATIDEDGKNVVEKDNTNNDIYLPFYDVFRESNNASHTSGYMLTYKVDNPDIWNTWYTKIDGTNGRVTNQTGGTGFEDAPTYTPTVTALYGQQEYKVGNIIAADIYNTYQGVVTNHPGVIPATGQAKFEPAYIVTADMLEATNFAGTSQRFYKNATLGKSDYMNPDNPSVETTQWAAIKGSVAEAYIVNRTVQLSETEYIYRGTYMTEAQKTAYYNSYYKGGAGTEAELAIAREIDENIVKAYYCYEAGKYGGDYYQAGNSYRGLAAFSGMSEEDRSNFTFNYDAFDVLYDPNYSWNAGHTSRLYGDGLTGELYQYDGTIDKNNNGIIDEEDVDNPPQYSLKTPIDYTATFKVPEEGFVAFKYIDDNGTEQTIADGKELSRTEFESLLNERYYYSPVTIKKQDGVYPSYYVVNTSMILGDTPYASGQVIDKATYDDLTTSEKTKVTVLTFDNTASEGTYYYCRESYTIAKAADGGKGVSASSAVTNGGVSGSYAVEQEVPVGVVIDNGTFMDLNNYQANFYIHGLAPTETSTLYVPRYSDIDDLSTEKIITVVYQYDYVESDMAGTNIVPVSERHVLNIHLSFKSGIPTVEDILAPDIILPGTTVSIQEPYVTPGAYEVTGGGWELFDDITDAESHTNGIEYTPNMNPLYLYQNQYQVAYYAQTYLGKTYSNAVPVTVANYHDLKKVMDAKAHHYYIDHKDLFKDHTKIIEPKIYINDYSSSSENGLDLFKSLYDLSVLTSYTDANEDGLIDTGTFKDHKPLNTNVAAGNNLEFFLRTDIAHPDNLEVANEWTPIGSTEGTCFEGTLHGDGHTLSGLDNSLFNHLCGDVYNLGVMGSFTGAGIAETGGGYVENCWTSTSSTAAKTSKPVFGTPNRSASDQAVKGAVQIVNSYYQEEADAVNKYTNHAADADYGFAPTRKSAKAFNNGEVAYDLNGFYLYKRYCDPTVSTGDENQKYNYFTIDENNSLQPQLGKYYAANSKYCSSGYGGSQYVEDRFADGDFRYAAGEIPTEADERLYVDPNDNTKQYFFPIWPDDYLFFGQELTYGYSSQAHNSVPTAITRFNGRLSKNMDANRVYRAPAYYRNKTMSVAHFNPHVYLAAKSADGTKEVYPDMTAIDFAGHNDTHDDSGNSKPYELGINDGKFYPPLLDDDGLLSIVNQGETQNLLVYAPAETDNKATYDVLNGYFEDPEYDDYEVKVVNPEYKIVANAIPASMSIYGHVVQYVDGEKKATNDHLLVDMQEFNAPIAYDFDGDHRMWYQRLPEDAEYVDNTSMGWQGISLPFTADLVTTHQKGEITHFYSGSNTSANSNKKIGHEYWLREFTSISLPDGTNPATANMFYPLATGDKNDNKSVTNTFLWDYYYENENGHNQKDKNNDIYQQYYDDTRYYEEYPRLAAATPYILGLPGVTYYEFDLSGNFFSDRTAITTAEPYPDKLDKQVITFASKTGISIDVSDDEMVEAETKFKHADSDGSNDYAFTFHPNYLKQDLKTTDYALNSDGDAFNHVTAEGGSSVTGGASILPFRPFFSATKTAKVGGVKREMPSHIVFSSKYSEQDEEGPESGLNGGIEIYTRDQVIVTKSNMKVATTIRIVNVAGVTINSYVLEPGQTVETRIHGHGTYIVNRKKIFVN